MPIDTSIYNQLQAPKIESPLNALASVLPAIEGLQKNKLMQQQMADTESMNELYRTAVKADGSVDRAALFSGVAQGGMGSKLPAMLKQYADVDKEAAAANKTKLEAANLALGQHRALLNNVNDPATAKQWLVAAYQNPDTKRIFERFGPIDEALRRFDSGVTDQASFEKWKQRASLNADELVKLTTPDANTVANNQTSRANNAATNATTQRGQNMTDARQREAGEAPEYKQDADGNWIALPKKVAAGASIVAKPVMGQDGQPLKAAPKAATEFQGKSAGYGARAEQADKIISQLTGNYSPAAVNSKQSAGNVPLIGGMLEAGANMALPANAQKAEQAQRDFVNAVLRQESGAAISPSEFDNAKKQYFPQPGDGQAVIQQKSENRKLAIQGFKQSAGKAAFSAPNAAPATTAKFLGFE